MTTNLQTLKDIQPGCVFNDCNKETIIELRSEAIKWIKYYQKETIKLNNHIEDMSHSARREGKHWNNARISFILQFFDLNMDDVKEDLNDNSNRIKSI